MPRISCSLMFSLRFLMTKVLSGSRLVRSLSLDFVLLLLLLFAFSDLALAFPLDGVIDLSFSDFFSVSPLSFASSEGGRGGCFVDGLMLLLGAFFSGARLGVLGALPPETTKLAQDPGAGFEAGGGCCCCLAPLFFFPLFSFEEEIFLESEPVESSSGASSFVSSTPPPGALDSSSITAAVLSSIGSVFFSSATNAVDSAVSVFSVTSSSSSVPVLAST
mmetsp:Transcript_1316/g.2718  ORF Transcript_1316/g.2718 Transcript_1316/m.2718 type:complete len:219 (-) Transcript_1316:186-842(-)